MDDAIIIVFDNRDRVLNIMRPDASNLATYIEKTMGSAPDPGRFNLYAQIRPFDCRADIRIGFFPITMEKDAKNGKKHWAVTGIRGSLDETAKTIIESLTMFAHLDIGE
jgi:hypothetical protein